MARKVRMNRLSDMSSVTRFGLSRDNLDFVACLDAQVFLFRWFVLPNVDLLISLLYFGGQPNHPSLHKTQLPVSVDASTRHQENRIVQGKHR